jgi:hypothetical protein
MPLNEVDKAWVKQEIAAAQKRAGWGYVAAFLKDWGGVLGLGGFAVLALSQWLNYVDFKATTSARLDWMEKALQKFDSRLDASQLEQLSPTSDNAVNKVSQILKSAQSEQRVIDPQEILDSGSKFVKYSSQNPAAWSAALQFVNYKSYINSFALPLANPNFPSEATEYHWPDTPAGMKRPAMAVAGSLPEVEAARFDYIGQDGNHGKANGDAYIFLTGGGMVIDGMQMRSVVFRDVHIVYGGGPVIMKDVRFINCIFEMEAKPNPEGLALALLDTSPSTTFYGE